MRLRVLALVTLVLVFLASSHAAGGGGDVIIKMKNGKAIGQLKNAQGTRTLREIPKNQIYLVHVDNDVDSALVRFKSDGNVESAERNSSFRLNSAPPSLDYNPSLGQDMMSMLDGQTTTSFNGSTVLKAYAEQAAVRVVGVDLVRGLSTGAGTRIGYIDTGVDPNHPALRPWLEPGIDLVFNKTASEFDGLSQDMMSMLDQDMMSMLDKRLMFLLDRSNISMLAGTSGSIDFPPAFGHGTLVAGLIHLVAPDARIVPIKAFDAYGNTTVFTLIESVYRAIDLNLDVLNMSFSTTEDSDLLRKAISSAHSQRVSIVASAGNEAREGKDIYPASYPLVYGVAATDINDRLTSFSNYGTAVAITAPGAFVISTVPGGRYAAAWGTSFSAPIVAGAIALRASWNGHGNSEGSIIVNTADSIDALNPGFEKKLGKGRVNVSQALRVGK